MGLNRLEVNVNREGYWASDSEPHLPNPMPVSWAGKVSFLRLLATVEGKARETNYKGSSPCRLCDQRNGSTEYTYTRTGNTWVWPSGLSHYIRDHQVRPSLAFEEFITNAAQRKVIT